MKNLVIIFFLVLLLFGFVFCAYLLAFNAYFSNDRLAKETKRITRMLFQRENDVSLVSLSPFGRFNLKDYSIAAKGGFKSGTLVSINSAAAKISVLKMLRRDFYVENVYVKGVNLNLDYGKNNKTGYAGLFSNLKYLFMGKSLKQGLIKSFEIRSVFIDESKVNLKFNLFEIDFKNVILKSDGFDNEDNFNGKISFDYEIVSGYGIVVFSGSGSLSFKYNNSVKTIYIRDFLSPELSLSAEGEIKFLEEGELEVSYVAKINKTKLRDIISNYTGFNIETESDDIDEEIIITYPFANSSGKDQKTA
ncbi:MAG: hypothetical protein FWD54_04745 [Endomicrobia bacterium]|nr:hypothetical protein [Endomicrobiia bacterium]